MKLRAIKKRAGLRSFAEPFRASNANLVFPARKQETVSASYSFAVGRALAMHQR